MFHTRSTRLRHPALVLGVGLSLLLAACAGGTDEPTESAATSEEDTTDEADDADDDATEEADDGTDDGTDDASSEVDRANIVATTSILGDLVENLVDGEADVEVIMPAGTDPHGFEPSASDGRLLREADLVVANGLDLEESMLSILDAAEDEGVTVFTLADKLDPIDFDWDGPGHDDEHGHDDDDGHGQEEDEHGHDHDGGDPHFWFDPTRSAEGVELLAAELAEHSESLDEATLSERAQAYADELLALDDQMASMFETIPEGNRQLVTNHDALGYLADRYGFEVVGTVIPGASTQAEQDPAGFAALIETVEEAQVPAVFAENTDSTTLAEQLQSEVVGRGDLDVDVVRIYTDALGEDGSGAETYIGLLETTSTLITEALGGSAD